MKGGVPRMMQLLAKLSFNFRLKWGRLVIAFRLDPIPAAEKR